MKAQAPKRSSKSPRTDRQTPCDKLAALLDSAERIMLAAHRRGAPALGPTGRAIHGAAATTVESDSRTLVTWGLTRRP
jgi:hypothetical protein